MVFVKVVKNKAYFKRFQVKYRRRREGKTDYRARRQMVLQDKTKFGSPKYRLVVRITNKDVVCQIVHANIRGDDVVASAYSHELPAFGLTLGLTNYSAAYCTGLLCARRLLTKNKIADKFEGVKTVDGQYKAARTKKDDQDDDESRFPFKAILDVGLARTTTGARVFAAMKGAVDGGIAVPHRPNRFPGFNKEKDTLDPKPLRDRIFGAHVGAYLEKVKAEAAEEKTPQFSKYIAAKLTTKSIEDMYKKVHTAIRADPMKKLPKKEAKKGGKRYARPNAKRLTRPERKDKARKKVATLRKKLKK